MLDFGNSLADTLKSGGNIVNFARQHDITIAQASRLVWQFCQHNPKYSILFKDWPQNIATGYIFMGHKHKQHAEHTGLLRIGQHVIGVLWNKKRGYYEIFRADKVTETCFVMGSVINGKFQCLYEHDRPCERWYSEEDIALGAAIRFGQENHCNAKLRTQRTRVAYRRGMWLGMVSAAALVNVNYNWR